MATITVSDNTTGSTVGGIEDNELDGFSVNTNRGASTQAYIDAWVSPDALVMLALRIPIPAGSGTVSNAKLRLYMTEKGGTKTALRVFEILRSDWSESQSTYNDYKTGSAWTTGGAQGVGTDRGSTVLATVDVASLSTGSYIEFTGSALTTLVQNAVTAGTTHINVIVQFTDLAFTSSSYVRFVTSEGTNGQRPQLVYDLASSGNTTNSSGDPSTYTRSVLTAAVSLRPSGATSTYLYTPLLAAGRLTSQASNPSYASTVSTATGSLRASGNTATYNLSAPNASVRISVASAFASYSLTAANGTGQIGAGSVTIPSSGDPATFVVTPQGAVFRLTANGQAQGYSIVQVEGRAVLVANGNVGSYTISPVGGDGIIVPVGITIPSSGDTASYTTNAVGATGSIRGSANIAQYFLDAYQAGTAISLNPDNIDFALVYEILPQTRTLTIPPRAGRLYEISADARTLFVENPYG